MRTEKSSQFRYSEILCFFRELSNSYLGSCPLIYHQPDKGRVLYFSPLQLSDSLCNPGFVASLFMFRIYLEWTLPFLSRSKAASSGLFGIVCHHSYITHNFQLSRYFKVKHPCDINIRPVVYLFCRKFCQMSSEQRSLK